MKAMIVEDEPLSRRRLRRLLSEQDDVEIVGEAGDVDSAVRTIIEQQPDLVFLDIQLSDGSGFDVMGSRELDPRPLFVIVTAFDRFAVRAFEIDALDYLLKPFGALRVQRAVIRARRLLEDRDERTRRGELPVPSHWEWGDIESVVEELRREARLLARGGGGAPPAYLTTISVRLRDQHQKLDLDRVDHFASADNYVEVHVGPTMYLLRRSLASLEEVLNPTQFVRIHRRRIVRIARVTHLRAIRGGELLVELPGGTLLKVGRAYRSRVDVIWAPDGR